MAKEISFASEKKLRDWLIAAPNIMPKPPRHRAAQGVRHIVRLPDLKLATHVLEILGPDAATSRLHQAHSNPLMVVGGFF